MREPELSVLLIEDEPDAARLIQHVLAKGNPPQVAVDWASDLRTGLDRLGQRYYHAVLLDLNLPDSNGFDTFASIRQKATGRAVVVLTGEEDEALAIQTMRAGADEYLIKSDVRDRFLLQRIRYAVERNRLKSGNADPALKDGKVLSFVGAKGGAGTTTLMVYLAAAFARLGKSVVAIELSPDFSSLPVLLNHLPSSDIATLLRVHETISRDAVAGCLEEFGAGFRALCGPRRPEDYRPLTPTQGAALLAAGRMLADYVLVDVPSASMPSTEEVIERSTFTTLVVERNRLGLEAALAKMPRLQAMTAQTGAIGAVLVQKTPTFEFLTPQEFGKRLGCEILGVIPPTAELQTIGESDALPLLSYPEWPFSQAVQELAWRLSAGARIAAQVQL